MLGFGNLIGLLALLFLIPLIILYLIRPKPTKLKVPSLMFFIKQEKTSARSSFLRKLLKDILFLLQVIVILFLALSIAEPWLSMKRDVSSDNVVLVLDVSASMKVMEDGKTRFENAVKNAKSLVGRKNTLILVQDAPILALEDASADETIEAIKSLSPLDVGSNLGDAMILAGDKIGEGKGRIFVISDFISNKGIPVETARDILSARGMHVDLIQASSKKKGNNVGIVNLIPTEDISTVYLKNFNDKEENVQLTLGGVRKQIVLGPNSIEALDFRTGGGITEIKIENEDDFDVDNVAFISKPENKTLSVLLVTNKPSKFLKAALSSSGVIDLEVSEPPVLPAKEHDVYIFDNVDPTKILKGTFEELKEKVESGSSVVVNAQKDSLRFDYGELLPVYLGGTVSGGESEQDKVQIFSKDINFGIIKNLFDAKLKEGSISVASVNSSNLISYKKSREGFIVYYGIFGDGEFRLSSSYPVFWTKLVKFLAGERDVNDLNYKSGMMLELLSKDNQKIVIFDQVGVYDVGEHRLAANMLREEESNVFGFEEIDSIQNIKDFKFKSVKDSVNYKLMIMLILIAFIISLIELAYIKTRGEV